MWEPDTPMLESTSEDREFILIAKKSCQDASRTDASARLCHGYCFNLILSQEMCFPETHPCGIYRKPFLFWQKHEWSVHAKNWNVIYDLKKKLCKYCIEVTPSMDSLSHITEGTLMAFTAGLSWRPSHNCWNAMRAAIIFMYLCICIRHGKAREWLGGKVATICTLWGKNLQEYGTYRLNLCSRGALYKQVRNLVGGVWDVSGSHGWGFLSVFDP